MEYITERRGGWDEWGDPYEVILRVVINGKEFDRYVKDVFTDENGNKLEVDFPTRKEIGMEITIERYDPTYESWKVRSLNEFEDLVDVSSMTISTSELN